MKKSLSAVLVVILTFIGANALAAKLDFNVKKVATETQDTTGTDNERTSGACRSKNGN